MLASFTSMDSAIRPLLNGNPDAVDDGAPYRGGLWP